MIKWNDLFILGSVLSSFMYKMKLLGVIEYITKNEFIYYFMRRERLFLLMLF